jgi:hypothetical protein
MARMTEEEADALDELLTKTTPPLKQGQGGFFTRQRVQRQRDAIRQQDLLEALDTVTAAYIRLQAEASRQSPAEIIKAMVRKELAASL